MSWRLPRCGAPGASPCSPAGSVSAEPRSRGPTARVSLVAALASLLGGISPLAAPPALLLGAFSLFAPAPVEASHLSSHVPTVSVAENSGSLVLTWTPSTNNAVNFYRVRWRVKQPQGTWQGGDQTTNVAKSGCGSSCSYTISSLNNGTTYEVQVGVQDFHTHWPSSSNEGTPAAPTSTSTPAAPTNLSVTSGDGSLVVSWTAPSGTLTGYDLHYTSANAATVTNTAAASGSDASAAWVVGSTSISGAFTTYTQSSLTNGTAYRVRLRAKNSGGNGAWAFTTGTPNIVLNWPGDSLTYAEGATAATIGLSGGATVGSAVSGTLTYAAGATNPASLSADLTTGYATNFSAAANSEVDVTLATLVNDTVNEEHETFTIRINAGTGYVVGTPATTTFTITDNDPPAAPSGLSLTAGSGKLSASWTKPAGPVTGYQLRYKQTTATDQTATTAGDPSTGWVTSTASITTTSGEITGLTNDTAYHVQVRATDGQTGTGNGYGDWSASRSGTPEAAASTDATLSALTASSATSSGGSYSSLSIGTFASGTTSYTATVANTVTHVKLTPTVNDSGATVKVGKQGATLTTVSSGSASGAIALAEGANALTVTVTAEDGTTKSYTVTVTRGQSNDATLSGLTVTGSASTGGTYAAQTLSPAFAASTDTYTVNVAKGISHVKLTATTTDSGATMKVLDLGGNDVIASLSGGTASRALPVNPDRNILVLRVTAADGTTKDYYVYVDRLAVPRNLCVEVGMHPNGSPMLLISAQDAEIDTSITYSQAVSNGQAADLQKKFQVKRSVDASWPARASGNNWPAGSQADSNLPDGSGGAVAPKCGGVNGIVVFDLTEPGVTYNVRAHHLDSNTFAAYGESTAVKTVTTWSLPGKPTSVSATAVSQDHTKLRVAWTAPTSTGGTGAQITGYKVRWRVKDADGDTTGDQPGDWNNDDGVAATGTTHDATGLSAATEYEVQVRALNGINPGSAWSDAASGTTGRPTPAQAPTNLVVTAGDSKLDLYWTASSGAVTGYDVQYTAAASGTVSNDAAATGNDPAAAWVALTRSGTTAAQTISSLSNGTAYRVRVRGKNSVGNSDWVLGTGTPAVISNDATLSALTATSSTSSTGSFTSLSIGTFASGTTSYTATVANTVTHVKLTPTVNDSGATVKVGKQGTTLTTVSSGSASGAIPLAVGSNAITVEVTAEDGTTTKSYTVTVTRQAAASTDATLSGLTASSATSSGGSYSSLSIGTFASGTTSYTATVANTVTHVKLTPTVNDSDATVKVGKQGATLTTVTSGTASSAIALAVGANAITVEVTAEDGTTTKSYTVTVTRQAAASTDATLSGLTASSATSSGGSYSSLSIGTFASGTTSYTATVANTVTHVKLTPTVNDSDATVKVGKGSSLTTVSSGSASGAIALAVGANALKVEVTAEDGTTTKSYTVTVTCQQAAVTTTTTPTPDPDPDPDPDPSGGNTPPSLPQEEITPPQEIRPPLVVSVMGGEAVTEGEAARFTVTATPPPVAGESISVAVTVNDSGDFAAPGATGTRTVVIDEGGTASFSVATQDDALYEDDGAITATVVAGDGYVPSSSNDEDTATVKVENNDPAVILSSPTLTISGGSSSSYTMRLPQEPTAEVSVDIITVIITVEPEPEALNQQGSGGGPEGNSFEPSYFAAAAGEATALSLPVVVQPSRLVFSPSDWDRPQRVTVTIAAPRSSGAAVTTATLIHRPSGGGYSGAAPVEMQLQVVAPPPPTEETTAGKAAQRAWHLRAGRSVSQQVVDALQQRFTTSSTTPSGLQLTLAGETVTSDTPLQENHLLLSRLLGFENLSSQEVAHGSSFSFSTDGDGPRLSFWGKGAFSSFNGVEESITLTGEVTTALLAAEWNTQRWQAGAALSHSWGNGSYQGEGDGADGRISSTLTGIFPYGRYALTPRLGVWATAGYGWGNITLNPDGDGPEYNPATTLALGAVGMDGLLLDGGREGITLTTTADALFLKTTSEAVEGLASSEGNISRLRLGLEASRAFPLANGAALSPSLEVGLRQDNGDAETGFGMDLGAGLSWNDPERGVTATVKGRTLLSHGAEDFQDQGLALSFSWQPSPSNRGPSFSLSHAVGLPAEGGLAALLNPTAIEVLDEHNSGGERFEARLAYGFPFYNNRLTLSPAVAMALSTNSRSYGLLWSLAPYDEHLHAEPWELSLEGERHENLSSPTVDHSLKLRFALSL